MYDLCAIIQTIHSPEDRHRLFQRARKVTPGTAVLRGRYRFEEEEFSVQSVLGGGESGRVMRGTFGARTVVIKRNVNVAMREDVNEAIMQTRLYCYLKEHGHMTNRDIALVPEAVFTASIPGFGRLLGMEPVDTPLLAHVQQLKTPSAQVRSLRGALVKVCQLLVILQEKLSFMHGDLHGENVMVRGSDVFLIDFGMSSARFDHSPRMRTSARYDGIPFHTQLDLMTLLTSLREDLGLSGHDEIAAWCGAFVDPFWDTVRTALLNGTRTNLPYGAQKTVRTALDEISSSGEVYYAHHLLYEDIGRVSYPPCEPRNLLRRLRSPSHRSSNGASARDRLFEDV